MLQGLTVPLRVALYEEKDSDGVDYEEPVVNSEELRVLGVSQIVYIRGLTSPIFNEGDGVKIKYLSMIEMANGDTFLHQEKFDDLLYRIGRGTPQAPFVAPVVGGV